MRKVTKILAMLLALALIFSMSGCGKLEVSQEIATVNGRVITKAEYMYYLENVKQQMLAESGAEDAEAFWNGEIDGKKASDAAKEMALEEMLRIEIACVKAEEAGVALSSAELSQIRATVKTKDAEQKLQISSVKSATGLSDKQLINLLEKTSLASAYANQLNTTTPELLTATDEEIKAAYEAEYVRVKHVLIGSADEAAMTEGKTDEEIAAEAEAYKTAQKAKAEDVLKKAKAGTNFDNLVKEYGEDPGMESSPDGYTFTKGTMVPEFETASYALSVGEVSDLVESSYGWHIIKKYALPTSGEEYDAAVQNISAVLSQEKFNAVLDEFKPEMTIEWNEKMISGIKIK